MLIQPTPNKTSISLQFMAGMAGSATNIYNATKI